MCDRGLRIIKMVAFGLIFLPEPITTIIGLAILGAAGYISRKSHARMLRAAKVPFQVTLPGREGENTTNTYQYYQ